MRNPGTKIWIYLAMLVVGGGFFVAGASAINRWGEEWLPIVTFIIGATLAPISLSFLIYALLHTRGLAKLRAGEDIIARWSVLPQEWEQFRVFDRIRAESGLNLGNDLTYDDERPPLPVEVIVGRKSALIGDSYHVLRKGGIPFIYALYWLPRPADPECLEFHIAYPRHRTTSVRLTLRFPVPLRYRAEGIRVYEHFEPMLRPKLSLALRNPGATIRIALVVVAVCASSFAWAIWQAERSDGNDIVPLIVAVVGAIFGTTALLVALLTFLLSPRKT